MDSLHGQRLAATDLHSRAHGLGGHRGYVTTSNAIKSEFTWLSLELDVKPFCQTCLHCLSTIGGDRTPRPLGEALHATRPNEVIHFDFLYLGPSDVGLKYFLLIKDDLSGYVWLIPSQAADAATVVDALLSWFAAFGVSMTWVSDQGSPFKNTVLEDFRRALWSRHHFTTAYSPWANGTVERACKEVLRASRALLSEFRLRPASWPEVIKIVQTIINNSPSPQRGNIAPLAAFTGRPADSPLLSIVAPNTGETKSLPNIHLQQLTELNALRPAVHEIHKRAFDAATSRRASARAAASGRAAPNFELGDFVLVARRERPAGDKLTLRWRGPMRIVSTLSEHVYEVQSLETESVQAVHATRFRF
jgi:Integrase core domain/Integrase zinc binding domain